MAGIGNFWCSQYFKNTISCVKYFQKTQNIVVLGIDKHNILWYTVGAARAAIAVLCCPYGIGKGAPA